MSTRLLLLSPVLQLPLMDAQRAAQAAYEQLGFFVLEGLPPSSEFGLDTLLWRTDRFKGVKFIPPGLHLFAFSAAPTSANEAIPNRDSQSSVGARHGLLRFYRGNECIADEWDNVREELKSEAAEGGAARKRRRRRILATSDELPETTIASPDYLRSLDKSLAPYPQEEISQQWPALVEFITEKTLARVVGLDESGAAHVDALSATADDAAVQAAALQAKKQTWGKPRGEETGAPSSAELLDAADHDAVINADEQSDLLQFVRFDEKRSWPRGAVGEDLTRWSKDKSWQVSDIVHEQLDDDVKELLGELQLSFVLFSLLHNFAALGVYRSLFAIICRASTLVLPPANRPPAATLPTPLLTSSALPLYASFLTAVRAQVDFLESSFFSTQLPSLEQHLLDSLAVLVQSLSDALPHWTRIGEQDSGAKAVWNEVVKLWDALAQLSMTKFGWDLGVISGSHAPYASQGGRVAREEGEVDLEDLEEGEDAPQIIGEDELGNF